MVIEKNKIVFINYSIKDEAGEVLEDNQGYAPEAYLQGGNNLLPMIEQKLEGKKIGEQVEIILSPLDAHGLKDDQLIKEYTFEMFEDKEALSPGEIAILTGGDEVLVLEKKTNSCLVDLNHPLAGKTLYYTIQVSGIRNASPEEISTGQPLQQSQPSSCGPAGCC